MSVIQVISGGQTGVDQAALRAAKSLQIQTGGWMPFGWTTEEGPRPEFADLYGMRQHSSPRYPARTRANVRDSDLTIWLGALGSRGYQATAKACNQTAKRLVCIWPDDGSPFMVLAAANRIVELSAVAAGSPVLNFAGNRESGSPGIGEQAEAFFLELFAEIKRRVE